MEGTSRDLLVQLAVAGAEESGRRQHKRSWGLAFSLCHSLTIFLIFFFAFFAVQSSANRPENGLLFTCSLLFRHVLTYWPLLHGCRHGSSGINKLHYNHIRFRWFYYHFFLDFFSFQYFRILNYFIVFMFISIDIWLVLKDIC